MTRTAQETRLPTVCSFWHGELSWLERLCITSFVREGHPFVLYAYHELQDVPAGVEVRDAGEVVPRERLFFYKGHGTVGVFSDLFRASLLRRGAGIWVDCDVFCLRPLEGYGDYIVGYERAPRPDGTGGSLNGAVLLCPADSPLVGAMLSVFTDGPRALLEPHLPLFRRLEVAARRLGGQRVPAHHMQYGATGPFALTYFARRLGLEEHVLPVEVFYPVPYADIPGLMQTGGDPSRLIVAESRAIHIWRSQLTRRGRTGLATPQPGSWLRETARRLDIDVDA